MLNERMQHMSASQKSNLLEAGIPETKPAYSTFTVDDQGRIWVKHTQTEKGIALWTVLNSDSESVYEVVLPPQVNLRVVKGNRAYASGRDDNDAPIVVVYDLGD